MGNGTDNEGKLIKDSNQKLDSMEQMLCLAYSKEGVPQDVKIRLKNRMACHKAMETRGISFWWLPATVATVISLAIATIICMLYVVININGVHSWMPNLLQLVSEMWLKIHLFALGVEVVLSWLFTLVGIWKGNLIKSAKLM